jgi:Cu/Ag efflux protein CusF
MGKKQTRFLGIGIFIVIVSAGGAFAAEKGNQTEVEMHHPKGWTFTMPKGDPAKGRAVYDKFSCHSCHEIRGEKFPPLDKTQAVGPELSQMGPLHPLEYFTESIINPSAVGAKKYRGTDGKSKMPSFNADMTVQELIDVSAYLASLRPKGVPKFVAGVGKVIALVPETQQIVVDHEEIKGFMDAMTMGYKVSPMSLLATVKAGDKIRFTIDTQKQTITKIDKVKN